MLFMPVDLFSPYIDGREKANRLNQMDLNWLTQYESNNLDLDHKRATNDRRIASTNARYGTDELDFDIRKLQQPGLVGMADLNSYRLQDLARQSRPMVPEMNSAQLAATLAGLNNQVSRATTIEPLRIQRDKAALGNEISYQTNVRPHAIDNARYHETDVVPNTQATAAAHAQTNLELATKGPVLMRIAQLGSLQGNDNSADMTALAQEIDPGAQIVFSPEGGYEVIRGDSRVDYAQWLESIRSAMLATQNFGAAPARGRAPAAARPAKPAPPTADAVLGVGGVPPVPEPGAPIPALAPPQNGEAGAAPAAPPMTLEQSMQATAAQYNSAEDKYNDLFGRWHKLMEARSRISPGDVAMLGEWNKARTELAQSMLVAQKDRDALRKDLIRQVEAFGVQQNRAALGF